MFKLSPNIDKNKIFLVNLSEIEGRLDPIFYSMNLNFENFIKLKKIGKVQGGKRLPKGYYYSEVETDYIYLRVSDLSSESNINWNNVKYISKNVYELLKRYQVFEGDLVFSIAGTVGKIKMIKNLPKDKKVILTENAAKIKIKDHNYLTETLEIVLKSKILQTQIDLNYIQTTIPKIGLDRIENLFIPYFNLKTQQKIIDIYETAYKEKQQKEAKAERLLNSIDGYFLKELGITLPDRDNSLENRIFKVNFSEVTDNRWDNFYYQMHFKENINNIKNGKYKIKMLKFLIKYNLIKGKLPNNDEKKGENRVVQISSIDNYGNIDLKNLLTAKDIFLKEQKLKTNDILVVITGATIGKIGFWDYNGAYYLGGDLVKFQTKENVNPYYLFSLLRSKPYQIEIERSITGATNGHLSPTDIEQLPIILPPLEKQNEIAKHIKQIREQAKRLKAEAKEVLEQAKAEVEKIILGETR